MGRVREAFPAWSCAGVIPTPPLYHSKYQRALAMGGWSWDTAQEAPGRRSRHQLELVFNQTLGCWVGVTHRGVLGGFSCREGAHSGLGPQKVAGSCLRAPRAASAQEAAAQSTGAPFPAAPGAGTGVWSLLNPSRRSWCLRLLRGAKELT